MKSVIYAFFLSFINLSFAQDVSMLKNGDKLEFKLVTYGLIGTSIVEEKSQPYSNTFIVTEGGHSLKSSSGRIENYKRHVLQSTFSGGSLKEIPLHYQFEWVPKDFSPGVKDSITYSSGGCGTSDVKVSLSDILLQEGVRNIPIKKESKVLKVYEILYKGTWVSLNCGTGRVERLIVFSPELNLIIESKEISFDKNNFFYSGNSRIVVSVN